MRKRTGKEHPGRTVVTATIYWRNNTWWDFRKISTF